MLLYCRICQDIDELASDPVLQGALDKFLYGFHSMLAVVKKNFIGLDFVSARLADDEIVIVAVRNNSNALQYGGDGCRWSIRRRYCGRGM